MVQEPERPNIIFILTDDQRWDALGYAGNELIQTPAMDRLAREGAYFSKAIVTTPICSASRASIFSGLYERAHRYTFQTGAIQERFMNTSYPALLKNAGYYTGFFGKFGVNYPDKEALFDQFEEYDRNNRYKDQRGYYYKQLDGDTVHLTRYTGAKAIEFIENAPVNQPFCLSLSFSAPHAHDPAEKQYFWEDESDFLYQDQEMPGPALASDQDFMALPEIVREGFNRTRWYWRYDTPEKYQHSVKGYYRMIADVDRQLMLIRGKLEEKGLADNTVIMLMGDNGYFLGERQLAGKWLMYDNSIRVPMIIYDPRADNPVAVDEMALNIDIPATIADLAGVDIPTGWHGKSLLPAVNGDSPSLRDTILIEHLWEFEHIPPSESVRTSDWKYMRYVNDQSLEELYNLQKDPAETENLATSKKHQDVLLALRKKCDQLTQKFSDPDPGRPQGLMVEYIREPSGTQITDSLPEYAWIVPTAATFQKGYQLLVASSPEQLAKNNGDVWDSGELRSQQSINVTHGGDPLAPNQTFYWKVRIWDQDNRLTDYSQPQKFTTGNYGVTVSSPNVFEIEKIAPVEFVDKDGGNYFVDFGKDAFGTLILNYNARKNESLTIRLGEKLAGDHQIDQKPGGSIRYQEVQLPVNRKQQNYIVQLPPDQRNTNENAVQLPDSFEVLLPFRYVEIEGAQQPIQQGDLRQKAYFHYFDDTLSHFSSSDTVLNQVWDICKYSMKATSFTGLYVDGDRERIPYEADAYINQLGHYCTDREYAMAKQTIEWFMKHPTWPTEWLLHTAMMMYQDYYFTGDLELIDAYYDLLKHKTLMKLTREDGLITSQSDLVTDQFMAQLGFSDSTNRLRDIVDWPPAQKDTGWTLAREEGERDGHEMLPINTVVNSFFYLNMKWMAELAGLLNKAEDQDHFELMAARVKKTINEKLLDKEKGIYVDGEGSDHSSIHSNMLPLAVGLVPTKYQDSVLEFIKSRGMACSVYGSQYLMEGLYEAGSEDYALDLMTATNDRSWWNMIEVGSTITMEAWDMRHKSNADWNHAWGAVPANIIPRYLWGIQPAEPGFKVISIKPQLADLEHSELVMPTIRGMVKGNYRKVNDRLQQFSIELPGNTAGDFYLQEGLEGEVTVNGKVVNPTFESIRLEPGMNEVVIRVNTF